MADVIQFDERTFRRLAELAPDALIAHAEGRVVWANDAAAVQVGVASAEAMVGMPVLGFVAPRSRALVTERIRTMLATGHAEPMIEEWFQRVDGREILVEVAAAPVGGGVVLVVIRDITARRDAELRLAESERRYRELFDLVPVGVWEEDLSGARAIIEALRARGVTDFRAHFAAHPEVVAACAQAIRVLGVNATACRMLGARDSGELLANLHRVFTPDVLPELAEELARLAEGERMALIEGWNGTLDGGRRWVALRAAVAEGHQQDWSRMVVTTADITERRQAREEADALREQLQRAEKLEAVGRLAGGVAHDFNNLLAGIMAHTELALMEVPEGSRLHESLKTIEEASQRARDLVRQILTFGHKDQPRPEPLELARVVADAVALARPSMPATVELVARLAPSGVVLADRTQVHRIVLNLCTNARDAVGTKGQIVVEVAPVTPGPELGELKGRPCARLQVRDDGAGMDEATRARIFEPYMTTRATAGGHGLGLAVVHGIVSAAGGAIRVQSAPGRGSVFDVYLPTVEAAEAPAPPVLHARGGRERILLVDDEPLVLSAHRRVLSSLGYVVTVAADAEQALLRLRAGPDDFDLVISDQSMPGLSGFELARIWLAERPRARVLLCTGFSEEVDDQRARAAGLRGVLLKPVSREALDAAVRAALG
jgi:PAS domain S-box-containing protein